MLRERGFQNLVVGVTGNVMEDDIAQFLAAGADMVLPKPLKTSTVEMLLQLVAERGHVSVPGMKLVHRQNKILWEQF